MGRRNLITLFILQNEGALYLILWSPSLHTNNTTCSWPIKVWTGYLWICMWPNLCCAEPAEELNVQYILSQRLFFFTPPLLCFPVIFCFKFVFFYVLALILEWAVLIVVQGEILQDVKWSNWVVWIARELNLKLAHQNTFLAFHPPFPSRCVLCNID